MTTPFAQPPPETPLPSAILETCLDVDDLLRARDFYTSVFGYTVISSGESFCALSIGGAQILLLFLRGQSTHGSVLPFGTIPPHGGTGSSHIGFKIPQESLDAWTSHLEAWRIPVESRFTWPTGGTSIYFRDPDGHLLELLTPGVWPTY